MSRKIITPIIRTAAPLVGGVFGPLGAAAGGVLGTALTGGNAKQSAIGGLTAGLGGMLTKGLGGVGLSGLLGSAAGTPLASGVGPTAGSGLLGGISRGLSSLSGALGGGASIPTGGLSSIAAPITGGSLFGNGGLSSILGGYMQNQAIEKQKDRAIAALDRSRAEYEPYKQTGLAANSQLANMLSNGQLFSPYNAAQLQQDPGYQFRLAEGQKALDRKAAASGNYFSGDALKAAQQYGQEMGSQEYQNAFNRNMAQQQNLYNALSGQQRIGYDTAGRYAGFNEDIANVINNAGVQKSNILSQLLGRMI